ncbi:28 kDa heat- and acid-stable phosphoprotein [Tanacetum coccineum]
MDFSIFSLELDCCSKQSKYLHAFHTRNYEKQRFVREDTDTIKLVCLHLIDNRNFASRSYQGHDFNFQYRTNLKEKWQQFTISTSLTNQVVSSSTRFVRATQTHHVGMPSLNDNKLRLEKTLRMKITKKLVNPTTIEREEIEKQRAHERYMKLQEQGKTDQAKKDLGELLLSVVADCYYVEDCNIPIPVKKLNLIGHAKSKLRQRSANLIFGLLYKSDSKKPNGRLHYGYSWQDVLLHMFVRELDPQLQEPTPSLGGPVELEKL